MNQGRFQTVQSRLSKTLVDWNERYMASSGKEILFKSIAQAIPTYVISVFKLLYQCDNFIRIMHQYWWGVENERGKMA